MPIEGRYVPEEGDHVYILADILPGKHCAFIDYAGQVMVAHCFEIDLGGVVFILDKEDVSETEKGIQVTKELLSSAKSEVLAAGADFTWCLTDVDGERATIHLHHVLPNTHSMN